MVIEVKKEYEFNNNKYILEKDDDKAFDYEIVKELFTDYFDVFDYVFGDISYNKLRLKGFCEKTNKRYNKTNSISDLDKYIADYCAFNSKWFLLKKIKPERNPKDKAKK